MYLFRYDIDIVVTNLPILKIHITDITFKQLYSKVYNVELIDIKIL